MNQPIISTLQLSKNFGNKVVLHDINLSIYKGETIAFTGENGSGKSTMLKMIGGLTKPSSGKIVLDHNLKMGYIPERFDKINFTIPEYLYCIGSIDGLKKKETEAIAGGLYHTFLLEDMLNTPMKFLSKGTLQKVAVIQALLVQPDVLMLDEPLSGQDYLSQKKFVELMIELKQKGVTIVMSCHEQFLIEQLADRILNIEHYNLVESSISKENRTLPFYIMLFQNPKHGDTKDLEKMKENNEIHEMTQKEDIVRVVIIKEKGQEFLRQMLQKGFTLLKFEEL